jgi:hypothetical protein
MILNKFRSVSFFKKCKTLSIQLLAIGLFSCSKTSNPSAFDTYISLTHVAYGVGPVNVVLSTNTLDSLFPSGISFGQTSGTPGNLYSTALAGVQELSLYQGGIVLKQGNSAFQQQAHYNIFIYDSLIQSTTSLIIFQSNQPIRTDTFTYIRYINFSPGDTSWGLKLINNRKDIPYSADTVIVAFSSFVGLNPSPTSAAYNFVQIRTGNYNVFAFRDSVNPAPDSSNFVPLGALQIDSLVNYNIYLQGFFRLDTTVNKFQLISVPLN